MPLIETNGCMRILGKYETHFAEIGIDEDHVHFLAQGVLKLGLSIANRITKRIIAMGILLRHPAETACSTTTRDDPKISREKRFFGAVPAASVCSWPAMLNPASLLPPVLFA